MFHIADSEQEAKAREERRARGYVYAVDAHMNLRAEFLSSVLTLHDLTCIPLLQKCEIREEHIEAKQGIASLRAKIKYFFVFTKKRGCHEKEFHKKRVFSCNKWCTRSCTCRLTPSCYLCRAKDKELQETANCDTIKSPLSFFVLFARLLTHNTLLQQMQKSWRKFIRTTLGHEIRFIARATARCAKVHLRDKPTRRNALT